MFWAYFCIISWIILGVGIILLIIQVIRRKHKKAALLISGIGLLLSIGSYNGFRYAAPEYGSINLERNDYNTVKRAVHDFKLLSKISNNATDKQLYAGSKSGKDLQKIVKSIPENYDNHRSRKLVIQELPTFTDNESGVYVDSQQIESLIRISASIISKNVTPKDEGKDGQQKVYKQMIHDSGYKIITLN